MSLSYMFIPVPILYFDIELKKFAMLYFQHYKAIWYTV